VPETQRTWGVVIAAFINGGDQHSAKLCDLGIYLEGLKKDLTVKQLI